MARSLVLKCPTWDHVEAFYSRKVKDGGGLSARVPFHPARGEIITLALELPDELIVALDAEVEQAVPASDGKKSAVRLRMIGLTRAVRSRLETLVAEARREQAQGSAGPAAPRPRSRSSAPPMSAAPEHLADDAIPPPLPTDAPVDELVEPPLVPSVDQVPAAARPVFEALAAELRRMHDTAAHQILRVRRDADATEIRDAYFSLTKQLHPDGFAHHRSAAIQHLAGEVFIHVNRAYERMRDDAVASGSAIAVGPDLLPHRGWMAGMDDLGDGRATPEPTAAAAPLARASMPAPGTARPSSSADGRASMPSGPGGALDGPRMPAGPGGALEGPRASAGPGGALDGPRSPAGPGGALDGPRSPAGPGGALDGWGRMPAGPGGVLDGPRAPSGPGDALDGPRAPAAPARLHERAGRALEGPAGVLDEPGRVPTATPSPRAASRPPPPPRGGPPPLPRSAAPPPEPLTSDGLFGDMGAHAPEADGADADDVEIPPSPSPGRQTSPPYQLPRRPGSESGGRSFRAATGINPPRPAAEVMAEARDFIAAGEWARAREILAESLRREPRNRSARALYHLASAEALLAEGKAVDARTQLEVALAHDPGLAEARAAMERTRSESARKAGLLRRLFK